MTDTAMIEAQRVLEDESRALGAARYRQRSSSTDVLEEGVDEASLPPGRALLRRALIPTAQRIAEYLHEAKDGRVGRKQSAAKLIADVDPDALAYLTLRSGMQAAVKNDSLTTASVRVGNAVKGHMEALALRETNKRGAEGLERTLASRKKVSGKLLQHVQSIYEREGVALGWSDRDKLLVGSRLIELVMEATDLFSQVLEREGVGRRHRKTYKLQLEPTIESWLERQHTRCELLDPVPLPMVVTPRPWTSVWDGGYLEPVPGNKLIKTRSEEHLELASHAKMPEVLAAVNTVQSTAWKINSAVLHVLREAWRGGGGIGGLPKADPEPLPGKPLDFDRDAASRVDWNIAAEAVHRRNAVSRGKRIQVMQKLSVAEKFADYPEVFFPHDIDFRGRLYVVPSGGPHPQGNDIDRALLMFAKGLPLGASGGRWLAVHLANLFGQDKVCFDERVRWVEKHREAILDSASNPLDGQRFWTTADKPWQALAACFEWAGYTRDGEVFVSHLPVALDGSNSGLQHFTALLSDQHAAHHVNLVANDLPGDLYAHVARRVQSEVDRSSDEQSSPWKGGKVTRSITKRPCMTYAYAVSPQGMAGQIEEALRDLDVQAELAGENSYLPGGDNRAAANWLARVVRRVIAQEVPAARRAMEWLKEAVKPVSMAGLPVTWESPLGLPVVQDYKKTSGMTVEVVFRGQRLQLQLRKEMETTPGQAKVSVIDARRAGNSIAANFIHSLDAAHLMMVANACSAEGIEALAVIHDSFGTHAGNTDRLMTILRTTFVELYRRDPLARFREAIIAQVPKGAKVPDLPAYGDFDLEEVLGATYMFS